MTRSRLALLVLAVLLLTPALLRACLWDYDTLQMERSRFPSTLELITGKFLRHSPEFYQWRVEDRKRRLEREPNNLALYDDLAVAYSKIGQDDKAIDTILLKDKKSPDQYETLANLGTFYVHAGQLEKGVAYIDKAIAVNPNAHFGREKYQKYLVEYILSRRRIRRAPTAAVGMSFLAATGINGPGNKKLVLPLCASAEFHYGFSNRQDFFHYVSSQEPEVAPLAVRQAGVKGILGIMKFANFESPIVLEALGDMLGSSEEREDAKQLAARAYLKAAMHTSDSEAKQGYRDLAAQVLKMQIGYDGSVMRLSDLEPSFQAELNDANTWYTNLHEQERGWIQEGKNPEAEFDKLYAADPIVASPDDNKQMESPEQRGRRLVVIGLEGVTVVFILAVGLLTFVIWRYCRIKAKAKQLAASEPGSTLDSRSRPSYH